MAERVILKPEVLVSRPCIASQHDPAGRFSSCWTMTGTIDREMTYEMLIDLLNVGHAVRHALDEIPARHSARSSPAPGARAGNPAHRDREGGILYLVPERPIEAMRGIARGTKRKGLREKKDRH